MFSHLPKPTLDPILSLSVAYRGDERPNKVDLGIGVYRNNQGETPIMKAVSMAQDIVVENQKTKAYVGLAGCEEFNQSMIDLLLKGTSAMDRVAAIQTPGASGALRMLASWHALTVCRLHRVFIHFRAGAARSIDHLPAAAATVAPRRFLWRRSQLHRGVSTIYTLAELLVQGARLFGTKQRL